jgi:2-amino-4-hydroxy-6-hydroxymethyldihydropteridine diphosphokinase
MHHVFLGIGGNIGNKPENFRKVHKLVETGIGNISAKSSVYESPPWGFHADENFWNQVLKAETELTPAEVLSEIEKMESSFNRKRHSECYTSREMDVDILYYDDIFIETEELIIPHPRLHQRLFVLVPLTEIAPGFKHPLYRMTSKQLLENCKDESVIKKLDVSF